MKAVAGVVVDAFVRLDVGHSSITFSCCCNFVPRFLLLLLLLFILLLQVIVGFVALLLSSATTTSLPPRSALLRAKFTGALLFVSVQVDDLIGWKIQNADRR